MAKTLPLNRAEELVVQTLATRPGWSIVREPSTPRKLTGARCQVYGIPDTGQSPKCRPDVHVTDRSGNTVFYGDVRESGLGELPDLSIGPNLYVSGDDALYVLEGDIGRIIAGAVDDKARQAPDLDVPYVAFIVLTAVPRTGKKNRGAWVSGDIGQLDLALAGSHGPIGGETWRASPSAVSAAVLASPQVGEPGQAAARFDVLLNPRAEHALPPEVLSWGNNVVALPGGIGRPIYGDPAF